MTRGKTMKRALCGLLILGAVIGALGFTCRIPGRNYFKAKRISAAINTQLPLGCDKSQVVAFLDAQGIEHSSYYENEEAFAGRFINAIVRDTAWGFLCNADMQMNFSFDAKGKLAKCDIDQSGTGP